MQQIQLSIIPFKLVVDNQTFLYISTIQCNQKRTKCSHWKCLDKTPRFSHIAYSASLYSQSHRESLQ